MKIEYYLPEFLEFLWMRKSAKLEVSYRENPEKTFSYSGLKMQRIS